MEIVCNQIAVIHTDFPTKFGIPRQSGLAETRAVIEFLPEYRFEESLRGIEEYSHLWLIWQFHANRQMSWSPTVRPPRLGGNRRMGVFATRSPFRPNPLGLSSVRLLEVQRTPSSGSVLIVSGADLADGTPILDIKPYLAYTDSHPDAVGGFSDAVKDHRLQVAYLSEPPFPEEELAILTELLSQDPRPAYQQDAERIYGFPYKGLDLRFRVSDDGVLTVLSCTALQN